MDWLCNRDQACRPSRAGAFACHSGRLLLFVAITRLLGRRSLVSDRACLERAKQRVYERMQKGTRIYDAG